jgi:transcriptional regulator with XRE-family HTH domain
MDLHFVFASNLLRLHSERGFSQCELALEAGLDRSYRSRLENARNSAPELVDKLAEPKLAASSGASGLRRQRSPKFERRH